MKDCLMIKRLKNNKFLGLYGVKNDTHTIYEVRWCDSQGKTDELSTSLVKEYFDQEQAQSYLFAFADGYEQRMNDTALDIV